MNVLFEENAVED